MSRFSELLHSELETVSNYLEGDDPPRDLPEIRAVLSNITRHLLRMEARIALFESRATFAVSALDEALNSGDGSYRP